MFLAHARQDSEGRSMTAIPCSRGHKDVSHVHACSDTTEEVPLTGLAARSMLTVKSSMREQSQTTTWNGVVGRGEVARQRNETNDGGGVARDVIGNCQARQTTNYEHWTLRLQWPVSMKAASSEHMAGKRGNMHYIVRPLFLGPWAGRGQIISANGCRVRASSSVGWVGFLLELRALRAPPKEKFALESDPLLPTCACTLRTHDVQYCHLVLGSC
jgi:hypothetical protein